MKVLLSVYSIPGVIFATVVVLLAQQVFLTHDLYHLKFHSALEGVGGVAALNLFALLILKSKSGRRSFHPWAQCGLVGMGTICILYSFASPSAGYAWVHSVASLAGGLFFSLVWVPDKIVKPETIRGLPIVVFISAISLSLYSLLFQKAVPSGLSQWDFYPAAKGLNLVGGALFVFASAWFFNKYWKFRRRLDEIIFAIFCLLFGVSEVLISFSHAWNIEWWIWQVVRLSSYTIAVPYVFESYRRSEKMLQRTKERYKRLVENSPDIVYIFSNERGGTYYSPRVEDHLGYSPDELLGKSFVWHDSIHPEDLPKVDAAIQEFHRGKPYHIEYRIKDKSGTWHWFHDRFIIRVQEGDEIIVEGLASDITEGKRIEAALRESETKYKNLVDNAPVGVFSTTVGGDILFMNDAMVNILGYDNPEEIMSKGAVYMYANHEDRRSLIDNLKKAGVVINFETKFITKSGKIRDILLSGVLSGDHVSGTIMDITERKRLEQELRKSETFLNEVGGIGKIGGWEMDLVTRKAKWTAETYNIVEIDRNDPVPGPDEHIDYYLPEYRPIVEEAMRALIEEDKPLAFEAQLRTARGNLKWCSALGRAIRDGDVCVRVYGTFQDITERKLAEMQVQEYAERQAVLLREVNHRVKNNLAVIIGMLHKEEDFAEIKLQSELVPILRDLEGRINGLLTVHSMFSATNWQPLFLSELCEQIIRGTLGRHLPDMKINIASSEVLVDSTQAHHLGMVIGELATNSLKYALSEPSEACIDVHIEEEAGKVSLIFRDKGPGYPEKVISGEYAGASIGFDLITGIVKKSLRGTISFRNENGAVAEIRFDKKTEDAGP